MNLFYGRKLAIATKHHKEKVIAQKVASKLGVLPFVPSGLDTDQLGTFTGEIERILSPLEAARKKCEMAMDMAGCDLAIASEGSFGSHPSLIFVPGNEELVLLLDRKNNLEIIGKKLTIETNFDGRICYTVAELIDFTEKAGFPSHRLILRKDKDSKTVISKGIGDKNVLLEKFDWLMKHHGKAFVETDMRAHYNPTRMEIIAAATDNLIERALANCEKCQTPGFGITDVERGLKCSWCGMSTQSVKAYILSCTKCGYTKTEPFKNKTTEDPMYCDYCNP
ncbi:DUF6671 family protein [Fulvivirga sp.]|uniref:DUF6671 family protein n=1 Tax=Fulvivirga sp. TaxID=1931237 RepID=UPI0032EDEE32